MDNTESPPPPSTSTPNSGAPAVPEAAQSRAAKETYINNHQETAVIDVSKQDDKLHSTAPQKQPHAAWNLSAPTQPDSQGPTLKTDSPSSSAASVSDIGLLPPRNPAAAGLQRKAVVAEATIEAANSEFATATTSREPTAKPLLSANKLIDTASNGNTAAQMLYVRTAEQLSDSAEKSTERTVPMQNTTFQRAATGGEAASPAAAPTGSMLSQGNGLVAAATADSDMDSNSACGSAASTTQTHHPTQHKSELLYSLPPDVLQHTLNIAGHCSEGGIFLLSDSLLGRKRLVVPPIAALRCCSKQLEELCNSICSSVFFQLTDFEEVKKYLVKLHLSYLSIKLASNTAELRIQNILETCHSLQPGVTSLALHHQTAPPLNQKIQARVKDQLLSWQSTLECLVMHGLEFGSWDGFISRMHALRAMELNAVTPALSPTNILECSRLEELNVRGSDILESTSLDVTCCPFMRELTCQSCTLSDLRVTGLLYLVILICSNNNIKVLQVASCTSLKQLDCSENKLNELDVTNNRLLEVLDCSGNPMTGLDLLNCELLKTLNCMGCDSFHSLSLANCRQISELHTSHKNVSAQELEACLSLRIIDMSNNASFKFMDFRVTNLSCLTRVHISNTRVDVIIFSSCNALNTLEVHNNEKVRSLIVTDCISLRFLSVRSCSMHYMDVLGNSALEVFTCTKCPVFALDFSQPSSCASMREVCLDGTGLRVLNMSQAAATLQILSCSKASQLKGLCISGCSKLSALDCSGCSALKEIMCGGCSVLDFKPLHFKKAADFHYITMVKLRGVGGLEAQQNVSVYMDHRRAYVEDSTYWPVIRDEDGD